MSPSFDAYSASNSIGPHHARNQDSFFGDGVLFAVADGVGGYEGAEIASSLAIGRLKENISSLEDRKSVELSILGIHSEIRQKAGELQYYGMGTTIALAKFSADSRLITANVGDSPILLFRKGGGIVQAYHDDSARLSDPRDMWSIVQYLGFEGRPEIHFGEVEYSFGDVLLLCSDGITDNLLRSGREEGRFSKLVLEERSAKKLVEEAIGAGIKRDDMTALLVFL